MSFGVPLHFNAGTPLTQERLNGKVDFVFDTGKGQRYVPMELVAIVGAETFRLTPGEAFLLVSKSSPSPTRCKVKLDFLTAPVPVRVAIQSDASLPLHAKTATMPGGSFMIEVIVLREELDAVPPGLSRGTLVITMEGVLNPATIALPVSLFVYE